MKIVDSWKKKSKTDKVFIIVWSLIVLYFLLTPVIWS